MWRSQPPCLEAGRTLRYKATLQSLPRIRPGLGQWVASPPSLPCCPCWPPWTTEPQTLLRLCVEDTWVSPGASSVPRPKCFAHLHGLPFPGARSVIPFCRRGDRSPGRLGNRSPACTAPLSPGGTSEPSRHAGPWGPGPEVLGSSPGFPRRGILGEPSASRDLRLSIYPAGYVRTTHLILVKG